MLRFESALAAACANAGLCPSQAASAIAAACDSFKPDIGQLCAATGRDGVVVPELVRQLRASIAEPHASHLHLGATSQDLIDTALSLQLISIQEILSHDINELSILLNELDKQYGNWELCARTRMQRARPIKVSDRLRAWHKSLGRVAADAEDAFAGVVYLQLGGPDGTRSGFGDKSDRVAAKMGELLALPVPDGSRHNQRDGQAKFANWLSMLSGVLGKIGQDIALMAQDEIAEITFSRSGSSSSMPHKRNPVQAELLVTLARYNSVQVSAMHQAIIHENERSGAAWTLEWMILPQMILAAAGSVHITAELLGSVTRIGKSS